MAKRIFGGDSRSFFTICQGAFGVLSTIGDFISSHGQLQFVVLSRKFSQLCNLNSLKVRHGINNDAFKRVLTRSYFESVRSLRCDGLRGVVWSSARCLKRLNELNVSETDISDEAITAIAENCLSLESLNVAGCWNWNTRKGVTDVGITSIATNCPSLNQLNVVGCKSVTDKGITEIATNCPSLNQLNVERCELVTDVGITAIAENCPDMNQLNVAWTSVTDKGITAIAENCPSLNQLNVGFCKYVTDEGINSIAMNCPNMNDLNVSCTNVTAKCVTDLKEKYPEMKLVCISVY